ncbi:hypothetical protein FGO68_gene15017 [Halteria grandinella]|uniref:Uncharacterized protein n=1 Tax=Halteria grandinella TaxID=5974 RepID=A0A8J8NEY6_HALGN|nr:hypothetical protein FGO68_gene15017 [Halteria grandinella]
MSSLISIALYINSQPSLLVVKDTYNYKHILDLNERSLTHPSSRTHTPYLVSHVEPIPLKHPQSASLILLFSSPLYNPFLTDELYTQPLLEIIKSLKCTSAEQLQKAVTKHQYELNATFSDILNGLDKVGGKGAAHARMGKKQSEFYEIKYSEVEQKQVKMLEQIRDSQLKSAGKGVKLMIEKVKLPAKLNVQENEEEYKEYQVASPAKAEKPKQISQVSQQIIQQKQAPAPQITMIEKLDMAMENQQISTATLSGMINLNPINQDQILFRIYDERWMDKSKFQIGQNPSIQMQYQQQQQGVHMYGVKVGKSETVIQYRVNPQLLSELPIVVMWTCSQRGGANLVHMKYMTNSSFTQSLDKLSFTFLSDNPTSQILPIDFASPTFQISQQHPLKLSAPSTQQQGILEFMTAQTVKSIIVEIGMKRLISGLRVESDMGVENVCELIIRIY